VCPLGREQAGGALQTLNLARDGQTVVFAGASQLALFDANPPGQAAGCDG
jgi:hypothetical protein